MTISSRNKILVWAAYILVCFQYFLSWHFENIDMLCRYIATICLLLSINPSKWKKTHLALSFLLIIALVIRRYLIVWVLLTLIYQIVEYDIKIKALARAGLTIVSLILLIQIEGVLIGFFINKGIIYVKSDVPIYDLGTGNANRCGALLLDFVLLLYVVCKNNHKMFFYITSIILTIIGFKITGSRTSFLCSMLSVSMAFFYWKGLIRSGGKYIFSVIPLIFFLGSFIAAFIFAYDESVNEKMSGRLWYIVRFTQEFSIANWAFGAPRTVDEPMDSAYLEIIHTGGIVLALYFCISFMWSSLKHFEVIKSYIPFLFPILVGGLTESIIMRPSVISIPFWILTILPYYQNKINYYKEPSSTR